jgi:hypothetical protein
LAQTRRTALTPRQRFARLRRNERAALLEYVALLREKFGNRVQDVILYGSRAARGMPNRTWMCW